MRHVQRRGWCLAAAPKGLGDHLSCECNWHQTHYLECANPSYRAGLGVPNLAATMVQISRLVSFAAQERRRIAKRLGLCRFLSVVQMLCPVQD
jgi:hypothetical protein